MRVTNLMLLQAGGNDLDALRDRWAKAQARVNGRALERPSDDPQRVMEAMDLVGAKERLARAERSSQDAREWLHTAELGLNNINEYLQVARELAVQAGNPTVHDAATREALARQTDILRDSLLREVNQEYRGRRMFAGTKPTTVPFVNDPATGGVTYNGDSGKLMREVAPGFSVQVNATGNELLAAQDFFKTLTQMAADLRAGGTQAVFTDRLNEITTSADHVNSLRSDLGLRYGQVQSFENSAQQIQTQLEDRIGQISGTDLEKAVLEMTQAQMAYEAALSSYAKSLPPSLLDHIR